MVQPPTQNIPPYLELKAVTGIIPWYSLQLKTRLGFEHTHDTLTSRQSENSTEHAKVTFKKSETKNNDLLVWLGSYIAVRRPATYQPGSLPGGSWGKFILKLASRLDAFSGYLIHA